MEGLQTPALLRIGFAVPGINRELRTQNHVLQILHAFSKIPCLMTRPD